MAKLKGDAARIKEAEVRKDIARTSIGKKTILLNRLFRIQSLFGQDGWAALMEVMADQKQAVITQMEAEEPIEDRDLQMLRVELVQIAKLLGLDSDISNRIDLLQQDLKVLTGKLAEGQVGGEPKQGGTDD